MTPGKFHPLLILWLLPKNWLSFCVGWAVHLKLPFGLSAAIRNGFILMFKVDTSEVEFPAEQYPTLGDFFVRRLKLGARPLAQSLLLCPVDGTLVGSGKLSGKDPTFHQIKGKSYPLSRLIGGDNIPETFTGGKYATLYLAPHNYHRIHAPANGRIVKIRYIPGSLWPVNTWSLHNIDGLFAGNERVVVEVACSGGTLLILLVGATNVGGITISHFPELETNRPGHRVPKAWENLDIGLTAGEELGCFHMGSTVILVADNTLASQLAGGGAHPRSVVVGEALNF